MNENQASRDDAAAQEESGVQRDIDQQSDIEALVKRGQELIQEVDDTAIRSLEWVKRTEYEQGRRKLLDAMLLVRQNQPSVKVAQLMVKLAYATERCGQRNDAKELLELAQIVCNDSQISVEQKNTRGLILLHLGLFSDTYEQAKSLFDNGMELFQSSEDPNQKAQLASLMCEIGRVYLRSGYFRRAKSLFDRSLTLIRPNRSQHSKLYVRAGQSRGVIKIAKAMRAASKLDSARAEKYYRDAISDLKDCIISYSKVDRNLGEALYLLGYASLALGRDCDRTFGMRKYKLALFFFEKANILTAEKASLAKNLKRLGTSMKASDIVLAGRLFEGALVLYRFPRGVGRACLDAADALDFLGMREIGNKNFLSAKVIATDALVLHRLIAGDPSTLTQGIATSLENLGKVEQGLGEAAQRCGEAEIGRSHLVEAQRLYVESTEAWVASGYSLPLTMPMVLKNISDFLARKTSGSA